MLRAKSVPVQPGYGTLPEWRSTVPDWHMICNPSYQCYIAARQKGCSRMKINAGCMIFLLAAWLLPASPLAGRDFVLSPEGNDRNPGTGGKPWKTLEHASRMLTPGDHLTLRDGTYPGTLTVRGSAFDAAPIRIFAGNAGKAVLEPGKGAPALRFNGTWNVAISGLVLSGRKGGSWLDCRNSGNLFFRNAAMRDPGTGTMVRCEHVTSAVFLFCRTESAQTQGAVLWENRNTGKILWYGCSFSPGPRFSMKFDGTSMDNEFLRCFFSGQGVIPSMPAADGELRIRMCAYVKGAKPDPELFRRNKVLFSRNLFASGGVPAKRDPALLASVVHNTVHGQTAAGPLPSGYRNNLFAEADDSCFRPDRPFRFRLKNGSPPEDTGTALVRVTGNVTDSSILPVSSAGFFAQDGLLRIQQGDTIWIGPSRRPARVVKLDRRKNLLKLDRVVDAVRGMEVTFPFHGAAPDRGCFEIGMDLFTGRMPFDSSSGSLLRSPSLAEEFFNFSGKGPFNRRR